MRVCLNCCYIVTIWACEGKGSGGVFEDGGVGDEVVVARTERRGG